MNCKELQTFCILTTQSLSSREKIKRSNWRSLGQELAFLFHHCNQIKVFLYPIFFIVISLTISSLKMVLNAVSFRRRPELSNFPSYQGCFVNSIVALICLKSSYLLLQNWLLSFFMHSDWCFVNCREGTISFSVELCQ